MFLWNISYFSNYNYFIAFENEEVSCNTSYVDMSISDTLFYNNLMATSTPIKQDNSISTDCKFM